VRDFIPTSGWPASLGESMVGYTFDWGLAGRRNGWGGGWADTSHYWGCNLSDSVGKLGQVLQGGAWCLRRQPRPSSHCWEDVAGTTP
jgi:hypothetical protein